MKKEKRNMNQVAEKKNSDIALAGMFEQDANTGLDNMGIVTGKQHP